MRTETESFPITVTDSGVTAKIYRASQTRNGTKYDGFLVSYVLLGKRKQVWRSDMAEAKAHAKEACWRIANGEQLALTLTNTDRMTYVRACEAVKELNLPIDTACREFAQSHAILAGRASLTEVCRDWVSRHSVQLPRIALRKAADEFESEVEGNKRSANWVRQITIVLKRFCREINLEVHQVTPDIIARWLSGLARAERTRRNCRDVVGYLCRFCVRRGYLAKGTDWLEGVQNYSSRKIGRIEILSPDELAKLLRCAERRFKHMAPFVAIGAFAGLRHAEIDRLDWQQVELSDKPGESFIEVLPIENTKSDQRRRIIPIRDTLKAWLLQYRKQSGPVCPARCSTKKLLKLAARAEVEWKRNALRHSCISYRIAECSNVPLIAEESGNSVQIIRTNYLRRVKPAIAAEWFRILPSGAKPKGRKPSLPVLPAEALANN